MYGMVWLDFLVFEKIEKCFFLGLVFRVGGIFLRLIVGVLGLLLGIVSIEFLCWMRLKWLDFIRGKEFCSRKYLGILIFLRFLVVILFVLDLWKYRIKLVFLGFFMCISLGG